MKNFTAVLLGLVFLLFSNFYSAQINGFAKVSAVAGTTISINSMHVNETFGSFSVGNFLIIMQMKGASISTSDDASFGNISLINQAGNYQIRQIASVTRTTGLTQITVTQPITITFDVNSFVQVITYPQLGVTNHTLATSISTVAWNGQIGGVTAFKVNGNLNLNASITADLAGFAGGAVSTNNGADCTSSPFRNSNAGFGQKGEGIYWRSDSDFLYARGKYANGGGGGNPHNGGGGGGSNFTAGGDGGRGFNSGTDCPTKPAGGIGGAALAAHINSSRFFLGGGGGGGQQNNTVGTPGARGGGIIMIEADSIIVAGSCTNRIISANGGSTADAGNDAAGGAGAGGSIVLDIKGIRVRSTCPLLIQANGGIGGRTNDASVHGGGGGGGQGAVIISNLGPFVNTTIQTVPGTGGCNSSASPCSSQASPGALANNSGIIILGDGSPLPVSLIGVYAFKEENVARIQWATASEKNTDYFKVLRSRDMETWYEVAVKKAVGNSTVENYYHDYDYAPLSGINYYRLEIVDFDGTKEYSAAVALDFESEVAELLVFPNPADEVFFVQSESDLDEASITLIDLSGKVISIEKTQISNQLIQLNTSELQTGVYFVQIKQGQKIETVKVVLK